MEFEDMKVIWDSQNEEPLYAVNRDGLRAMLEKKARAFRRFVFWQTAQTYGSSIMVIAVISVAVFGYFTGGLERLRGVEMTVWDAIALFVGIACWARFGIRFHLNRIRRLKTDNRITKTLADELDRDIERVNDEIAGRELGVLVRGYIPPHVGGMLFTWVVFRASGIAEWAIVPFIGVMITGFVWETRMQLRLVTDKLLPRKRELEVLRQKLEDGGRV